MSTSVLEKTTTEPAVAERRRALRGLRVADLGVLAGSAAAGLATGWLLFYRLTGMEGWLGFLLVSYLLFLAIYYFVCRDTLGKVVAGDRLVGVIICSGAVMMLIPLVWLLVFVTIQGLPNLRWTFFTQDQAGIRATDPATVGGGLGAIVGTLEEVGIAMVISVPLGILCALFLNETRSRMRRSVRTFVDAMSGLPSEVAGLFIFSALILTISATTGNGAFSGFMASLALSIIMLPTITRTVEVVLRLVPDGLREASYALGASQARTIWSVVLPTARSGLGTSVVLGIARTVGETAPLIFTAFGTNLLNANPFSGPQDSLPLFVYSRVRLQSEAMQDRAYTGAFVLMVLVLLLFVITRVIARKRHRN
ncbi:phosphate ABC transporter permease PstA [Fodinicola feengrottensis]|uniref:Phosphate transport system permease protein PstA n=1 Tax=Fodinicola feengrottensis TaxID=435914 RepID=A0ABN2I355_9ACTN